MMPLSRFLGAAVAGLLAVGLSGCMPRTGLELRVDVQGNRLVPGRDFDGINVEVIPLDNAAAKQKTLARVDGDTAFPAVIYVWDDAQNYSRVKIQVTLVKGGTLVPGYKNVVGDLDPWDIVPVDVVFTSAGQ